MTTPTTATTRVLIVDDHPLMCESLTHLIQGELGLTVVGTAGDVESAVQAIEKTQPHLVLVDITLKEGSGLTLLDHVAKHHPGIRTMVVSMHDEPSIIEAAFRRGARAFVNKSDDPVALLRTVFRVTHGELVATQEMLTRLSEPAPAPTMAELIEHLSDREREVFTRLGRGQPTRAIADDMGLSIKTVQTFCARIKDKLHLANGSALVTEAARWVSFAKGAPPSP